eukprot:TRINITY_DN36919_c0_g4_i1.p1 TRINITY_DN36919_c0_g4~~TRINITY_DN36919_c0_g4_i1.p1  ORF type:complete len:327 (+),score=69.06 TRINITY_DN36919_c0_g4_i1:383-1363(+)
MWGDLERSPGDGLATHPGWWMVRRISSSFVHFSDVHSGSTSMASSGESLSCLGERASRSLALSIHEAAERVQKLVDEGYVLVGVKRAQDLLSRADAFRLHGFVMLRILDPKVQPAIPEDGPIVQHVRLDWGESGLNFQMADHEEDLLSYLEQNGDQDQEAERGVVDGAAVGAMAAAAMGVAAAGAAATAMGVVVTAGTGVWLAVTAGMTAGLTVGNVRTMAEEASLWQASERYVEIENPAKGLKKLRKVLLRLEVEQPEYTVEDWNCNHFANRLVEELEVKVPSKDEGSEIEREALEALMAAQAEHGTGQSGSSSCVAPTISIHAA